MKKTIAVVAIAGLVLVAIAACVPYGPTVVAKVALLSQTSAVSYTTIYTPSSDGDYRFSIHDACSDASTNIYVWVDYTDEFDTYGAGGVNGTFGNAGRLTEPIHVVGGQPIQYHTYYTSTDSGYCDVYITLVSE